MCSKEEAVVAFALSVITKQLQDIEKAVKELNEKVGVLEEREDANYEDLVERISNLSTPGDDFSIERY